MSFTMFSHVSPWNWMVPIAFRQDGDVSCSGYCGEGDWEADRITGENRKVPIAFLPVFWVFSIIRYYEQKSPKKNNGSWNSSNLKSIFLGGLDRSTVKFRSTSRWVNCPCAFPVATWLGVLCSFLGRKIWILLVLRSLKMKTLGSLGKSVVLPLFMGTTICL